MQQAMARTALLLSLALGGAAGVPRVATYGLNITSEAHDHPAQTYQ